MQADLEGKQKYMKRRLAQMQGETSSGQSGSQQECRERQNLWVKDKDTIVEELTECRSGFWGVTIVGISGSGKTELANSVIKDVRIKNHFPYTCSPPPSPYFVFDLNTLDIVKKEIEIVKKDIDPKKKERALILLDDLQKVESDPWRKFRDFCETELHPESKVVVTSQNPKIADATDSFKHCLPKLCDDECFTMIQFFAGSNGKLSMEDRKAIKVFRKKLVKKCMGLPLLAKHIGLLLSAEGKGKRLNTVTKKLCSDLWMLEDFASVLGNLKLVSLLQKKPLLKWCLNYCSLFPPNTNFNKDLLVQLWMAEGLNLFQTEEQDFDSLVSHSIFQSSDNNDTYEMHQLAYEFAKNVSSKAFYQKDISESTFIFIGDTTRHFSLSCSKNIEEDKKTAIMKSLDDIGKKCKRLRTFLLVQKAGNIFLKNPTFFTKLELLRVLDLSYTNLSSLSPSTISKLGYLRYLDLSSTPIKKVPGLSNSPALQVLKLSNCRELLKLPKDLTNLTNLSCLQVNTAEKLLNMPPKMGKLSKLRELELFLLGNREEGFGIEELKELNGLRKALQIARLENVKSESEAQEAELINKLSLETLELRWTADSKPNTEPENVLEGLVPPQSLTELRITNYSGSKFPEWLSNPEVCGGLNTIILDNCNGCSCLPSLEKLELLKRVDLKRMKKLVNLPELPSSVKSLTIEESDDALKQHCQNGAAGWRKIRGIRVTIDSEGSII